jgi:uncharacterized protein (TIRG00374 family)
LSPKISGLKSKLQVFQYFLLLAIGIFLCWLFFRNFSFSELIAALETGNFSWFYLVMLTTTLVYVIRTLRWQMLIKATGYSASFLSTYSALSISYFVSLVIPRLGEITRCLSVKRQHRIPFMQLLGTVIIERVIDIISLMAMLLLTLLLQFDHIMEFVKENVFQPIYQGIVVKIIAGNGIIIMVTFVVLFIATALFFYFRKYIREKSPKLIVQFVEGLKQGIISISRLQQKKLFIFYTILIWLGYYFMTYFWFFVFRETSILGWGACLSIVSIGSIGRSVPIQGGGMGAYHFLVTQVVILYGVTEVFGKTLATCIHGGQVFFTFVMGLVGLIIFFVSYWRRK